MFVPGPPFPKAYGLTAAMSLGLGLAGGFVAGLYALGALAFGWPAASYAPLVQAHGQLQTLGLAGLLILGVGGILLPGFWRVRLAHPGAIPLGGGLVSLGLLAQLFGQPLVPGPARLGLLLVAAVLPIVGFAVAGSELARPRLRRTSQPPSARLPTPATGRTPGPAGAPTAGPAAWELLLLLGAISLAAALVVRAVFLWDLAWTSLPAGYGILHQVLVALELDGFLLAATVGVQLRLLPSLARTRPVAGWPEIVGVALLALAVLGRAAGLASSVVVLVAIANWLAVGASIALFWATGLGRPGLGRTVEAPATLLPGRTRWVLRAAWAGLLVGALGRATGLLAPDQAIHAFTSAYLVPLILVVGLRMLPRVSAYPVRFPKLSGALIWIGLLGGVLRAFGGLLAGPVGWQAAWAGGSVLALALLVFAALAWSPWGVPTGAPRTPEVIAAYRAQPPRRET